MKYNLSLMDAEMPSRARTLITTKNDKMLENNDIKPGVTVPITLVINN